MTWNDVVIEVLCWGWIDGIKKSIDELAYLQRITPRTTRSNWSKRNTEHVECLISEMEVPADFVAAAESQPRVKAFFETLNKSNRYAIAYGMISAKKPETRLRRFAKFMNI
ncbi:YdeI/OmpD-associated family protein [Colwellia sp. Bg11-28]|uniref:YdeI/OmpD-associated family protein n=1 Tax=Colwellia sp. Bg11-28 TaxID=2058305 RepID=UPI000C34EB6C|nr:YdeI/OmpD-associated family protein [Colwellia sp. Bg11-28]PKH87614.1 hypothetical protein CXF79_13300 [Colwellia sp. Bg11-28]